MFFKDNSKKQRKWLRTGLTLHPTLLQVHRTWTSEVFSCSRYTVPEAVFNCFRCSTFRTSFCFPTAQPPKYHSEKMREIRHRSHWVVLHAQFIGQSTYPGHWRYGFNILCLGAVVRSESKASRGCNWDFLEMALRCSLLLEPSFLKAMTAVHTHRKTSTQPQWFL